LKYFKTGIFEPLFLDEPYNDKRKDETD
jgi:hypothetical protein